MDSTQVAKKQKKDDSEDVPMEQSRMAAPNGGIADTSGRTSETPVSIPPTITYGLQDTHTTILPAVYWFSIINLEHSAPKLHAIRLNSIWDIISKGLPKTDNTSGIWTKKALDENYTIGASPNYTITGDYDEYPFQPSSIYPWYRDTWSKWYNWWTVLGCEYEITFMAPRGSGRGVLCAHSIQTSGTTDARVLPDNINLYELSAQKEINYTSIQPYNIPGGYKTQLKGTYKPGSAKRDVANDADIKLWTKTGSTPTYNESLHMYFYRDPLSSNESSQNSATRSTNLQVQVKVKYIVQWKNLKQAAIYPATGATSTDDVRFPAHAFAATS